MYSLDQNVIYLWRFHDAPKELQALSPNGGDEVWLALAPVHRKEEVMNLLGRQYDTDCMDYHDGFIVAISAHA